MTLRDTLRTFSPPTIRSPTLPERTIRQAEEIRATLGSGAPRQPNPLELQDIHKALLHVLEAHGSVASADNRTLRLAPWVLFRTFEGHNDLLGSHPTVLNDYRDWLASRNSLRPTSTLLHVLLQYYPTEIPTFQNWCNVVRSALVAARTPRLVKWRERCDAFGLLAPDGPARLATRLTTDGASPPSILHEVGLDGELATGRFMEFTFREMLTRISGMLERGQALDALTSLEQLAQPASPTTGPRLRFPTLAKEMAESLLMPFTRSGNAYPFREHVQRVLLDRLGDPRIEKRTWPLVREEARAVILGWLVEQNLRGFISILTQTADPIWIHRRDFWMRYLEKKVITEAWVVLGSAARRLAKEHFGDGFGMLSGASSDQSVLLMRIGGLTIAEWSHNGACRIWRTQMQETPTLYRKTYYAPNLRTTPDESIVHQGSDRWRWQDKIARYIRDTTGISWH